MTDTHGKGILSGVRVLEVAHAYGGRQRQQDRPTIFFTSEDFLEGSPTLQEKRKPVWRGR